MTLAPDPEGFPPVVPVPFPGAVGWVTLAPVFVPEIPPLVAVPFPGEVGWPVTLPPIPVSEPGIPPLVVPVPFTGAVG